MIEKPAPGKAPSNLAVMGRYILAAEIFDILTETLPGAGGEIQLTDGLRTLAQRGAVYAYEFLGERYDAGTPLGWIETTFTMALKDPLLGPELKRYMERSLSSSIMPR
jgi:UTP--glucose-1-phosphate uridylyltransferase